MSSRSVPQILIVAAEASSSLYAKRLLEHWQNHNFEVQAFGVGSREMEALGFECLGRSEDMAVVGLSEIISHWDEIKSCFHRLVAAAEERRPQVVLLLDYPEFNLRLAKKLKAMGFPIVYYISPQIWAWRRSRVHLIRRVVDKMLVLFPFEVDFYKRFGVNVDFVGHPLLEELKDDSEADHLSWVREKRQRFGVRSRQKVIALMPGSRISELKAHLGVQLETAKILHLKNPEFRFFLLVAPSLEIDQVRALMPSFDIPLTLVKDEPFDMISLADAILCASGTATLMVGLMEIPMVVMYRMNALSAFFARLLVKGRIPYFSMVNLILNRPAVPECFQEEASPINLSSLLEQILQDDENQKVKRELKQLKESLGSKGATARVAKHLEEFLHS